MNFYNLNVLITICIVTLILGCSKGLNYYPVSGGNIREDGSIEVIKAGIVFKIKGSYAPVYGPYFQIFILNSDSDVLFNLKEITVEFKNKDLILKPSRLIVQQKNCVLTTNESVYQELCICKNMTLTGIIDFFDESLRPVFHEKIDSDSLYLKNHHIVLHISGLTKKNNKEKISFDLGFETRISE